MVAEPILECSTRECTKWIPFVLSFLLKQEWTVEYFALPEFQCAAVFANQVARYNLLVEQIPLVLVAEGTDTLIVQFPGSIVISVRFYLLDVLLAPSTSLQLLLNGSSFKSPTMSTFASGFCAWIESPMCFTMLAANSLSGEEAEPP